MRVGGSALVAGSNPHGGAVKLVSSMFAAGPHPFSGRSFFSAAADPRHDSAAVESRSAVLLLPGPPGALHLDLGSSLLDLAQVVGREIDIGRSHVLLQAVKFSRTRD